MGVGRTRFSVRSLAPGSPHPLLSDGRKLLGTCAGGRTTKPDNRMSQVPAKEPPTQGHHQDMGTIQNTAALYLRKSSLDDRWLVIGLVDLGVGASASR